MPSSPTTPSAVPRVEIAALEGLVETMGRVHRIIETSMDLEEFEGEEEDDLDADIEDMDEFEDSLIEGDSMEL